MQKNVTQFTDIELKALKSDIYESQQMNMNNLKIINQELAIRAEKAQEKTNMAEEVIEEDPLEATEE